MWPVDTMEIQQFYDLKHNEVVKRHIIRCSWDDLAPQERSLVDVQQVDSCVNELLDTLTDRDDLALIAQATTGNTFSYALLTEHMNTWMGSLEGFVYGLHIAEDSETNQVLWKLLDTIMNWARERAYQIVRMEIPEREHTQALTKYMNSLGWATSGLIPCKLLLSLESASEGISLTHSEGITIRVAQERDYDFVTHSLAEAIWAGLSPAEKSQLSFEALLENVRADFKPSLRAGTSISYVADSATQGVCAQATAHVGFTHPILGIPEAELVDISIIPAFGGRGLGDQLTVNVLRACFDRNLRFARSNVVVEDTTDERVKQICQRIERSGWWINSRIMYRSVSN